MVILAGLHLPFMIAIIALYQKLGPKTDTHTGYSKLDIPKNCDDCDPSQDELEMTGDE